MVMSLVVMVARVIVIAVGEVETPCSLHKHPPTMVAMLLVDCYHQSCLVSAAQPNLPAFVAVVLKPFYQQEKYFFQVKPGQHIPACQLGRCNVGKYDRPTSELP